MVTMSPTKGIFKVPSMRLITISFFNKKVTVNITNKTNRSVINLSSYVLSNIQKYVPEKGLKFSPTPGEQDMNEILDDLRLFFRRMRLKAYFHEPPPPIMIMPRNNPRWMKCSYPYPKHKQYVQRTN